MNLVDSSGWLEYLADGPNAEAFAPALEDTAHLVVSVINLYEVFKRVLQQYGEGKALQVAALMMEGLVVPVTPELALEAARLSVAHGLPLADSLILATARAYEAILWTQDKDLEGLPDVRYIPKR